MCGLVGLAGDCSLRNKDAFTDLLYIDTLRGPHSTGAALVKRDKNETLLPKAPVPGHVFIGLDIYKKAMEQHSIKAMIGHNRFATVGTKSADNAHPFDFEGVVGAHNGTIERWSQENLPNWKDFGTDSEAIYNSINLHGLKDTVAKLYGAWALTFVDKRANTMNMIRNDKRPLFYAYSLDLETLYWASEAEMLSLIASRNKIRFHENRIFDCEPDTHYEWYLPEFMGGKFKKPYASKVYGSKWTYKASTHKSDNEDLYGSCAWYDEGGQGDYGFPMGAQHQQQQSTKDIKPPVVKPVQQAVKEPDPAPVKEADPVRPKINTSKFRPPYKDHQGHIMNKKQFFSLVNSGCVYCDDQDKVGGYKWGDFIHVLKPDMDGRKIFLCEPCYNDDEVRELVESSI